MKKRGSLTNFYDACFRTTISLVVALAPSLVHAQIIISEVMYDPTGSDDKQEWLELSNTGDAPVDVTKWTFSDGSSATKHGFNVPPKNGGIGSLTIPAGGYLIIADDAATFESAFPSVANVIDSTMTLPDPNAGSSNTVVLYDDQKAVADSFTYVAGTNADNKGDSMQRAGSGIIPALPTPGAANSQTPDTSVPADTSSQASTTQSQTQTSATSPTQLAPVSSYVAPPPQVLFADAGADRIEIVGADTEFTGRAYTRSQTVVDNVRYTWNFGDGSTAEGETVMHHYSFPGRYAVTLTVSQDKSTGSDRVIVTAEPAQFSFSAYADGSVEIVNGAQRDLDLSFWIVKSGVRQFLLPQDSLILAGASMRIAQGTLGYWSNGDTELDYPNGMLALKAGEKTALQPQSIPKAPMSDQAPEPAAQTSEKTDEARSSDTVRDDVEPQPVATATPTSSAQVAMAATALPGSSPWLWSALGIAGLGAVAGAMARKQKAGEWEIEEAPDTV